MPSSASSQCFVEYGNCIVRSRDYALLQDNSWINDVIISFDFEYLEKNISCPPHRSLAFIGPDTSHLIAHYSDASELPIVLEDLDLRSKSVLFFPVNDQSNPDSAGGSHWSLVVYDRPAQSFYHYDSMKGYNDKAASQFVNQFSAAYQLPKRLLSPVCSQQENGFDCGIFVLANATAIAKTIAANAEIAVSDIDVTALVNQENVSDFRMELAAILKSLAVEQSGCELNVDAKEETE